MSGIKLIVGLGNIGRNYEQTRHNAGFWFVDLMSARLGGSFNSESRFHGDVARVAIDGRQVWLLKPSTLMNLSGTAVAALANFYKIDTDQMLVVHDELDMMPGQVKLKFGGGVAGHNGLKDIRSKCGGAQFWRLRIGIGHPRVFDLRQSAADYVLKRPPADQHDQIMQSIELALDSTADLVHGQFEQAMQQLHTASGKPPPQ